MTRGRGCPVTRQQKRAHSPSSTCIESGWLTNVGAALGFASSSGASGTLEMFFLINVPLLFVKC